MRNPDRDRCRSAVAALGIAFFLIAVPALALTAEYRIAPNGTVYQGAVQVENADRFEFTETGLLGERIPIKVTGVSLSGDCAPCTFSWSDRSVITFPKGNYTVRYNGPIVQNHMVVSFSEPYRVVVNVPPGLDVRNRFIGAISPPDATVSEQKDGSLLVTWNATRSAELRFYPPERENWLAWFGQFWIIVAIVLILPFLLSRRKGS
ncbi:MAG TPA: hypothetical protein PLN56_04565 [Methanoregulaceae archaeon]|nr:MAG: hypothetical protein IPI71_03065 [Methanolinea sp.]HON81056.1 hypothetical protein [Methanoregulaceae archaeon]HPD10255.1 hypothetical protein [Methanoregulaceae archaeon]HRT14642.1 hypothetical protein [Methanoregulaceae archaeon]HRU30213.1 hypothetical protein [Methanoregulaceae archaeon]